MADFDYDLLADKIAEAIGRAGETRAGVAREAEAQKKVRDTIDDLLKLNKTFRDTGAATSRFKNFLLNQQSAYQDLDDLRDTIKKFDEAIENTTDLVEKAELEKKREELLTRTASANFRSLVSNAGLGLIKFTDQLSTTAVVAGGQFVRGLQRGASEIELTTGLMTAGADLAKQTVSGVGQAAQGLGTAMMTLPGKFKFAGAGLFALGTVLGVTSEKLSGLAKFGIEILGAEIEKTIGAYARSSAAGVIFANGMTEMRNSAHRAGLTIDTYSNIVSRNADGLVGLGGSVTAGNRRFVETSRAMLPFRDNLLNLGISIEDQAQAIVDFGSMIRITGQSQTMTAEQLAKETVNYVTNLRTLSNLTGEDAKRLQERSEAARRQAAIQAKLAELGPDAIKKFNAGLALVGPQFQDAFIQKMLGLPALGAGAVVLAQTQATEQMMNAMVKGVSDSSVEMGSYISDMARLRKELAPTIAAETQDISKIIGVVSAAGQGLGQESEMLSQTFRQATDASKMTIDEIIKTAEAQAKTTDPLTQNVNSVIHQMNLLKTNLEEGLNAALPGYSKAIETMTSTIYDAVQELKNMGIAGKAKGFFESLDFGKAFQQSLYGAAAGGLMGMKYGAAAGTVAAPGVGTAGGAGIGAAGGAALGAITMGIGSLLSDTITWWQNKEGKARGGIARGPTDGYIEKLHGIEAVVPLPDGKSIPVTIEMTNGLARSMRDERASVQTILPDMSGRNLADDRIRIRDEDISTGLARELVALSRLVEESNKTFVGNLADSKAYITDAIRIFADSLSVKEFAAETQSKNLLTTVASDYNYTTAIEQTLDLNLAEFRNEIKTVLNEVRSAKIEQSVGATQEATPTMEVSAIVNQLNSSNRNLQETLLVQNRLLEQNIQTVEKLISVASDTRNYSQAIAENTL